MQIQPDGKIILAGDSEGNNKNSSIRLARYLPEGSSNPPEPNPGPVKEIDPQTGAPINGDLQGGGCGCHMGRSVVPSSLMFQVGILFAMISMFWMIRRRQKN